MTPWRLMSMTGAAAGLAWATFAQTADDGRWSKAFYDPAAPAEREMTVPLPCGGAIVFVRVDVVVDERDPLDDRKVILGSGDENTAYLDYFRESYIRGSFTEGRHSYYWLGKYEVTRDQYAAVMSGECPEPSRGGMRPVNAVSWFDAVEFSRRLSEWVRENAPESLPSEAETLGYFRLPTEPEWEYAVRGGAAVDATDFRAPLFPMEADLSDYAWFAGRRSSSGSLRPIGMHKPNPLGLHGMLGGVAEFTLEPFRLNNLGRLHGQVGGFVTRGGSFKTEGWELRSSLRSESPYFSRSDGKALRDESFGIRLVGTVHVNVSLPRTNLIRDSWIQESLADPDVVDDPLALLDTMIESETETREKNELNLLRGMVLSDRRAREEAADRVGRLTVHNGAVVLAWLRQQHRNVRQIESVASIVRRLAGDAEPGSDREQKLQRDLAEQEQKLARMRKLYDLASSGYLNTITTIREEIGPEEARRLGNLLVIELAARDQRELAPFVSRVVEALQHLDRNPDMSRRDLLKHALD